MKKICLRLFTVIIAGCVVHGCTNSGQEKNESEITPVEFERVIKKVTFQKTKEANLAERDSNYQTGVFKKHNNNFYVGSTKNHQIHVYDEELRRIQRIGNGQGRGPGEVEGLVDAAIDDEFIWILDGRQQAVHQFNHPGEYVTSVTLKDHPLRITNFRDELVVSLIGTGADSLFKVISKEGEERNMFGNFTEDQAQNILGITGEMVTNESSFVFVPRHASLIYIFDRDYGLRDVIQTPDGQSFPGTERSQSGEITIFRAPESPFEARDAYLNEGKLFVMVYEREGTNSQGERDGIWNNYIDVYDIEKGEYLYSYKTEMRFPNFTFDENKGELCILGYEDIISCYSVMDK